MSETERRIADLIEAETGKSVQMDTKLDDLGIESLDFLEMITTFEKLFSTKIPDADFGTINYVRDLLRYVPA